jgi:hypothetical protein
VVVITGTGVPAADKPGKGISPSIFGTAGKDLIKINRGFAADPGARENLWWVIPALLVSCPVIIVLHPYFEVANPRAGRVKLWN